MSNNQFGKNVVFGVGNSLSVYIDHKKENISVPSEVLKYWVNDTTIKAKAKCSFNITNSKTEICLSMHYSWSNIFLYVNNVKTYKSKAKDSERRSYPLFLSNFFKWHEKNCVKWICVWFFVDCNAIDISDVIDISLKEWIIQIFEVNKTVFVTLLFFGRSLATKCIFLNNRACIARPTLISLNPDELSQVLRHYPYIISSVSNTFNSIFKLKI